MSDAATSDLPRLVLGLARATVAASRSRALYPPDHPAVGASLTRLQAALAEVTRELPLALGITPSALVLDEGVALDQGPAADAAALLHARDVLRLVFAPDLSPRVVSEFVELIAADPASLRDRGGPAEVWRASGLAGIDITQVDYQKVLEDRDAAACPARRDDLWQRIVRAVLERKNIFDDAVQRRLLEIAGDSYAIGELARDVMAPNCMPDGSPLLTTQAAAVVAAYNQLHNIVAVLAPERREQMFRNLAEATAQLDPRVVVQMMRGIDAQPAGPDDGAAPVIRGVAAAFDDVRVAQLLATTLALEGQASARLATVFETIAPDDERRHRVLRLTRTLLNDTEFGRRNEFESLWQSMEELLMRYDERPFVSADYRAGLDRAGTRADQLAAFDTPPELPEWMRTIDQDSVRRLSVALLIDLLNLETDAARAPCLAADLTALAEDMLMAGDYEAAADIATAMASKGTDRTAVTRDACRAALDTLGGAIAVREAVAALDDVDEAQYAQFERLCLAVGPPAVESLRDAVAYDDSQLPRARARASAAIVAIGAPAVPRLAPLIDGPGWHVQRNVCELLERIASPDAVPLLQPLLRSHDPRVVRCAVTALANIDDPAAARAIHTVLRAAAGEARRAVIDALTAEKDPRVVPVLARILDESKPLGSDHAVVLETLTALGALGPIVTDSAVASVGAVMRKRRWYARGKARRVAAQSISALRQVDTPAARKVIEDAAATGDRLLRQVMLHGSR